MTSTKLQWLDHFDSSWLNEDLEALVARQGVLSLHQKLINNKEASPEQRVSLELRGPHLPEYERGLTNVTDEEQDEFLNELLYSQLSLARTVCADSPFYSTLRRRLVVLQRIYTALSNKYHICFLPKSTSRSKSDADDATTVSHEKVHVSQEPKDESSVLVEIGVKTGLSLLFALFRQSWQLNQGQLCNDVLFTASEVLASLSPLCLSNESKIPPMGQGCLKQVTAFLKTVVLPGSAADHTGRQLACELLLRLSIMRGSLKYLLDWIEMAIGVGCWQVKKQLDLNSPSGSISTQCLCDVLAQIRRSEVSIETMLCSNYQHKEGNPD